MKKLRLLFSFSMACGFLLPVAKASGPQSRPVQIGGSAEIDACDAIGKVAGLRKGGDGFLSVRASPDVKAKEVHRLSNGEYVVLCEDAGDWLGVVFESTPKERKASPQSCNTSSPQKDRAPYRGPCKQGWIYRKWVEGVAG